MPLRHRQQIAPLQTGYLAVHPCARRRTQKNDFVTTRIAQTEPLTRNRNDSCAALEMLNRSLQL
jgi:hypothetical protein